MRIVLVTALLFASSACIHRVELMKANAVSMKYRELPEGSKVIATGDITSRYCFDEFKAHSGKDIGLIDETTKMAEEEHHVDMIRHVTFYQEGNCTIVEGEGVRVETPPAS